MSGEGCDRIDTTLPNDISEASHSRKRVKR